MLLFSLLISYKEATNIPDNLLIIACYARTV